MIGLQLQNIDKHSANFVHWQIVSRAYHGMFAQKVQEDYENVFGEQLSLDWLDTVSLCPSVSVEYQHNQAIITHNTVVDPNLVR